MSGKSSLILNLRFCASSFPGGIIPSDTALICDGTNFDASGNRIDGTNTPTTKNMNHGLISCNRLDALKIMSPLCTFYF